MLEPPPPPGQTCPQPSAVADGEATLGLRQASADGAAKASVSGDSAEPLRCTYSGCTSKEEDRIFTGRGAKPAHKRHMDTHHRPYTCPEPTCGRHTNGFSRRDNLNAHLKTHQKTLARDHRSGSEGGPIASRPSGIRKQLKGMSGSQRKRLVNVLLLCLEIGFEDDEEDGGDDDETDERSSAGDEDGD